ncbi:MAG: exodeoxyribonuclease I, partial [Desulfobacterales bacterium]|nr:exodeoxyribonuclease I [Desulfobacterales bacterium]
MKKTYLFYDIETTGLNKAFDQVLQFAAFRTDRQLNEIDRYTIKVQLRPDVIPSPGAII